MTTEEWIKTLKVGDEVAVNWSGQKSIAKVIEIRRPGGHLRIRAAGRTFDGHGMGVNNDRWTRSHIEPVTTEMRSELVRVARLNYVLGVPWGRLPADVVDRVHGIAKAAMDKLGLKP